MHMETSQKGISSSFVWAGIALSLLVAILFGFQVAFAIIDYLMPSDQLSWYSFRGNLNSLPQSAAFLLVSFGVLLRLSQKALLFSIEEQRESVWYSIRHAIIVFILALSVIVLVYSLASFLGDVFGGDFYLGLLFKTAFSFGVGAMVFYYYRGVLKDVWRVHASEEKKFIISVSALVVLLTFVAVVIASPLSRHELADTYETLEALDVVSSDIESFYRENVYLPNQLGASVFLAHDSVQHARFWEEYLGDRFTYEKSGQSSYQLCASFEVLPKGVDLAQYPYGQFVVEETGETCFTLDVKDE